MAALVIFFLVAVLIVLPIWVILRLLSVGSETESLRSQLHELRQEVMALREKLEQALKRPSPPESAPATVTATPSAPAPIAPVLVQTAPATTMASASLAVPPPFISESVRPAAPDPAPSSSTPLPRAPMAAPPVADLPPAPAPAPVFAEAEAPSLLARIDWEQFMGAKLFAWLGGLAALLGVAFFVKYSFEHDLIPPEVRVALGFVFAVSLAVGGLKINHPRYLITAHTLMATGIVSLYAVTFACHAVYHFAAFSLAPTFLLMALITGAAFLLAVRLEARVIAILGLLGGFLTPIVLSTGRDNPPGLFGYLAFLNIGLIAVALRRRWHFLVALGAGGTVFMQIGWAGKFLESAKAPTAMVVCLSFCALFLAAYLLARRRTDHATATASEAAAAAEGPEPVARAGERVPRAYLGSALAFPFVAFAFAVAFFFYPSVAARPGLLFGFIFLADACLLALAWFDEEIPQLHLAAGVTVFALLAAWTGGRLTADLLPWALGAYLLHAVLHTAFPLLLARRRPAAAPASSSQIAPPLALLLLLVPLFKLEEISLVFWPAVLLVDVLAIALALFTGSLTAVAMVLVLTLIATGVWIVQIPVTSAEEGSVLLVVGGFALLFFGAGLFVMRRLGERFDAAFADLGLKVGHSRAQIPAVSALLPFLLLILMTQRLPLADPSPLFGLALLLVGLALGLTVFFTLEWLPACALAGVVALEYSWRALHGGVALSHVPLAWAVLFYAVFAIYPFVFRRRFAALTGPWAIAALAGAAHFPLVYEIIRRSWPNDFLGLVPAVFALPPLLSLVLVLRAPVADARARLNQLAWFGGVALLFLTLIFPIQFERQWITLGWALEGVALLWLFHRVPHPGLRATGTVLLIAAFARLALNPAVLGYHPRGGMAFFNWYLYAYGVATACLFVAARLTAPPRHIVLGSNVPPVFQTLGTILAFLLLNVEIADFFSVPGRSVLTFEFSGNFARDMTYTIAWALFALGLLLVSIWKQTRAGRYAALGLLGVALLKLFVHDLARLEALYRVGALFAVAVIAIVASFAYQRFLPVSEKRAANER